MLTVVKRNKTYKNRKLVIYDGKKKITEVIPFWGWYSFNCYLNHDLHDQCRALIMKNLYWLLGHDCDFEDWNDSIEAWDKGRHIYNVAIDELPESVFFEGEKEVALNSFYN
jgi:hypothetical protein